MTSFAELVQLLLVVVPFIVSPGPGNLLCAATGARFGSSRSWGFIIGLELMVFFPALLVGVGVGEFLDQSDGVLDVLQVAGSVFMLYLAYRLLRDPIGGAEGADEAPTAPPGFVDAVVLQALNIKGAVILLVVFTQFEVDEGQAANAFRIAAVITAVSLVGHIAWMRGGAWLADRYSSPRALRVQGITYAAMLTTVALWLLIS